MLNHFYDNLASVTCVTIRHKHHVDSLLITAKCDGWWIKMKTKSVKGSCRFGTLNYM